MSLPILKFHPKDQQQQPLYSRSTSTMTTQTFDEDDIDCCYEDKLVWKRKHVFQPFAIVFHAKTTSLHFHSIHFAYIHLVRSLP